MAKFNIIRDEPSLPNGKKSKRLYAHSFSEFNICTKCGYQFTGYNDTLCELKEKSYPSEFVNDPWDIGR